MIARLDLFIANVRRSIGSRRTLALFVKFLAA
jgi:hypothetical protein